MDNNFNNDLALRREITSSHETDIALIGLHTYIQAATSQNTRRAYQQDIRHFQTQVGYYLRHPI